MDSLFSGLQSCLLWLQYVCLTAGHPSQLRSKYPSRFEASNVCRSSVLKKQKVCLSCLEILFDRSLERTQRSGTEEAVSVVQVCSPILDTKLISEPNHVYLSGLLSLESGA
jgi:hypothetical protein